MVTFATLEVHAALFAVPPHIAGACVYVCLTSFIILFENGKRWVLSSKYKLTNLILHGFPIQIPQPFNQHGIAGKTKSYLSINVLM